VADIDAETSFQIDNQLFNDKNTIEANSDRLKIESKEGTATFSGNVEVKLKGLILKAQEIIINYYTNETSEQEIKEVLAVNNVTFLTGKDILKADKALYKLDDGTVALTGNVSINQDGASFSGKSLFINLNTGEGTISGRVTAILGSGG
jgi:lipopolysaccharide export system protein LptA